MTRDAAIPEYDEDELREHVRNGLDTLREDGMFVHNGPESSDFPKLLDGQGHPPRIESEGHPFNRFLRCVALFIAQSIKRGHSKKCIKAFTNQLQNLRDLWVVEIQNYKGSPVKTTSKKKLITLPKSTPKESKTEKKKGKKKKSNKASLDDDDDDMRKRGRPKKENKESGFSKAFIQREHQKMKEDFEQLKEETVAEIPKKYSEWFRSIGFAKWGKVHYPVMFVGPYEIGPCEARDLWRKMFDKTGSEGRRHNMSRLVYWYGSEGGTQFSLVPQNSCMLYEQGLKKGFDKPWISVKKKMSDGKKLSKKDEETLQKWQEMEEDLAKNPEDRIIPNQMKEDHDALLDGELDLVALFGDPDDIDNMEESEDEELIDDDEDMVESPPKKRKPGRPKKQKDDEDSVESQPKKKKLGRPKKKKDEDSDDSTSKKKKLGRPKKKKDDEGSDDSPSAKKKPGRPKKRKIDDADEASTVKKGKKKKKKKKVEKEPVIGHVDEEDFAEHEESSIEEEHDEEEDEEAIISDADSADDDYAPEVKKEKKAKAIKKKTKEPGKKKKTLEETKESKKKKKLYKLEQQAFEHCENEYLHYFKSLEEYIDKEDVGKLESILQRILRIVDDLSAPFIQTYNIAIIMKDKVKPFIVVKKGKKDAMYVLYKQVFTKMGTVFKEKLDKVPEGFEPIKTLKKTADESPRPSSPQDLKSPEPAELPVKKSNGAKSSSDDLLKSSTSSSRPPSRAGQTLLAKTVRKAFSLGNLMRPKPVESQSSTTSENRPRSSTAASAPGKKEAPSWLMKAPEHYPSVHTDEDRKYAFEFFESLSAGFPDQKVDRTNLAKNLELAVFEWSQEKDREGWVDKYWEKTHSLVAAVRGKWGTGGLIVHKILKGTYATPRDVVLLSDDVLEWSFDGSS